MGESDRKRVRLTTTCIRVGTAAQGTLLPARRDGPRSCDRPIDRLCHELLHWDVSQYLLSNISSLELSADMMNITTAEVTSVLPSTHLSYSDYVACWVPAMLQELKDCIASKILQSTCFSARGYFKGFVSETSFQFPHHQHQTTPARIVTLSVTCLSVEEYQNYLATGSTGSHRGTDRPQLQIRDLILIAGKPFTHPREGYRQQPAGAVLFGQCVTAVGLVMSHRFVGGLRTTDISVSSSGWTRLVDAMGDCGPYTLCYCVLENLSSAWREFQAVQDLRGNDAFLPLVLASKHATRCDAPAAAENSNSSRIPRPVKMPGVTDIFMGYLRAKFNPSQLRAIVTAADSAGFTLVQGPPGTGKTSTIMGILNALHIRVYNQYYQGAVDAFIGPAGMRCRQQGEEKPWIDLISTLATKKPRMLVVAPSNAAVSNIVERLMESGFVDGGGGQYFPKIVCTGIGQRVSDRVRPVCFDELCSSTMRQYTDSSDPSKQLVELNERVQQLIRSVAFHQSLLVNLSTAFHASKPLPRGFEVRVQLETGQPYWVDHELKSTSFCGPDADVAAARGPADEYTDWVLLPDFAKFSHLLTQDISALDETYLRRNLLNAAMRLESSHKSKHRVRSLVEESVLHNAHIVFSTLNSAGSAMMDATEFCVALIDEAAQCVEPSILIALRRGCRQCIMVGDQKQLPATVFSVKSHMNQYDRSLFQRLTETGHPYIMLDTQYRMTPDICAHPSTAFYGGRLKSGPNVSTASYLPAMFYSRRNSLSTCSSSGPPAIFGSLMFLDLQSSVEQRWQDNNDSLLNREEASLCRHLVAALEEECRLRRQKTVTQQQQQQSVRSLLGSIGIIAPYSAQVGLLKALFRDRQCDLDVEVGTVDGFQGREKDIVIMTAVRGNECGSIGFVADPRRLNVALTRAKKALFVVGHADTLRRNPQWSSLIAHIEKEDSFVCVSHAGADLRQVGR